MKRTRKTSPSREARRGLLQLGAVNLAVAVLGLALIQVAGWILFFYPVLHLLWSVPWTVVAQIRGHHDYASGLEVALGLSSLAGCVCWGVVWFNLDFTGG